MSARAVCWPVSGFSKGAPPYGDLLLAGRRPALADVREAEEVAAGTLPGAHHLPLGEVVARAHEVPREGPVVVFCQRGVRSARAVAALAPLGFTNLIDLEGGFKMLPVSLWPPKAQLLPPQAADLANTNRSWALNLAPPGPHRGDCTRGGGRLRA